MIEVTHAVTPEVPIGLIIRPTRNTARVVTFRYGSLGSHAKLRAADVTIHYWIERAAQLFLAVDGANFEIRPGALVPLVGTSDYGATTFTNAVDSSS
jgi:ABC-type glutathione transport system ATPase component